MPKTGLFFACAGAIVLAQMLILRLAFSGETSNQGNATLPRSRRAAEVTLAFLPALGLALVLWMTWHEVRQSPAAPPAAPTAHPAYGAHES